jgi:hypothetical protein
LDNRVLIKSILQTLKWDIIKCTFICLIGESISLFYSYFIGQLLTFIQDKDAETMEGVKLVSLFVGAIFVSTLFKNTFVF